MIRSLKRMYGARPTIINVVEVSQRILWIIDDEWPTVEDVKHQQTKEKSNHLPKTIAVLCRVMRVIPKRTRLPWHCEVVTKYSVSE